MGIHERKRVDDLVQDVTAYTSRPLLFHGYLSPFVILQAIVYYLYLNSNSNDKKESEDLGKRSYEHWVIAVAIVIAAQILTYLFTHWSVDVKCCLCFNRVQNPHEAQFVKVRPTPNNGSTELVRLMRSNEKPINQIDYVEKEKKVMLWFEFQKTKYIYDDTNERFVALEYEIDGKNLQFFKSAKGYEDPAELQYVENLYGRNEMEMIVPEFWELFKERAIAPFFVFQVFCVGLWCMDEYWYYALFTLFMLVTLEMVLVKHQMRNMKEIRRMGNSSHSVQVYRQRKWRLIKSDRLVNGDLIAIQRGVNDNAVPCDIILVRGSCIVDESTLTGESIPQMKEPIESLDDDQQKFDLNIHGKLHILFGGTRVLQHSPSTGKSGSGSQDPGCTGYVIRTGFQTSQGRLLRTILFGVKRVTANNFETFCFIIFLLIFAVAAAAYVWARGSLDPQRSRYRLFFECTVIITSVVPPELPIELSLAVNTSLMSLSRLYIYCTEPFRIPFAGKVEYCCFDKTGTLTSDDLVIEGVAGLPKSRSNLDSFPSSTHNQDENHESKRGNYMKSDKSYSDKKNSIKLNHGEFSIESNQTENKQIEIKDSEGVRALSACPLETLQILATCHSLAHLDDGLVGDPLEKKILEAIDWNFTRSGVVSPRRGLKCPPLKICQRFHFNSTLKRMSVVASTRPSTGTGPDTYMVCVKGAPEMVKPMLVNAPANYDIIYTQMSRLGARVLALARRNLGHLSDTQLRELQRSDVERQLDFCGFVLITCPLKQDSRAVSLELLHSGHRLMMITGDAPLTACHVAGSLNFITKKTLILSSQSTILAVRPAKQEKGDQSFDSDVENKENPSHDLKKTYFENSFDGKLIKKTPEEKLIEKQENINNWSWMSIDESLSIPFQPCRKELKQILQSHDLCLTGDALSMLTDLHTKFAPKLIENVKVFARVSPKQKETIITSLKGAGHYVLMCGDGTNDVGALKHAHVGVALLSSSSISPTKTQIANYNPNPRLSHQIGSVQANAVRKGASALGGGQFLPATKMVAGQAGANSSTRNLNSRQISNFAGVQNTQNMTNGQHQSNSQQQQHVDKVLEAQRKLKALLEEQERAQLVKLGDASIAAPFTSRLSSVQCICHIIKQGRCTLVTTLQMFKILALNALISAYCHSVMYLDGIKFSDGQVTLQGLLTTACFLFITRSKPLKQLHQQRPLPNIFNAYTLLTVMFQFLVHFGSLVYLYEYAKLIDPEHQLGLLNNRQDTVSSSDIMDSMSENNFLSTLFSSILPSAVSVTPSTNINSTNQIATLVLSNLTGSSNFNDLALNKTTSTNGDDNSSSLLGGGEFKISIVNSTVYVIWLSLQISTFIVNYKGHPFMRNLRENRPLLFTFIASMFFIVACVCNWIPELREQLSLVEFTGQFQQVLLVTVAFDLIASYILDRICDFLFGRVYLKPLKL